MAREIVNPDWDYCYFVQHDNEEDPIDIVYFDVEGSPGGWYLSIDLDCESGHFTETMADDNGPYDTEEDALRAGFDSALEWIGENWPEDGLPLPEDMSDELVRFAWWMKGAEDATV